MIAWSDVGNHGIVATFKRMIGVNDARPVNRPQSNRQRMRARICHIYQCRRRYVQSVLRDTANITSTDKLRLGAYFPGAPGANALIEKLFCVHRTVAPEEFAPETYPSC